MKRLTGLLFFIASVAIADPQPCNVKHQESCTEKPNPGDEHWAKIYWMQMRNNKKSAIKAWNKLSEKTKAKFKAKFSEVQKALEEQGIKFTSDWGSDVSEHEFAESHYIANFPNGSMKKAMKAWNALSVDEKAAFCTKHAAELAEKHKKRMDEATKAALETNHSESSTEKPNSNDKEWAKIYWVENHKQEAQNTWDNLPDSTKSDFKDKMQNQFVVAQRELEKNGIKFTSDWTVSEEELVHAYCVMHCLDELMDEAMKAWNALSADEKSAFCTKYVSEMVEKYQQRMKDITQSIFDKGASVERPNFTSESWAKIYWIQNHTDDVMQAWAKVDEQTKAAFIYNLKAKFFAEQKRLAQNGMNFNSHLHMSERELAESYYIADFPSELAEKATQEWNALPADDQAAFSKKYLTKWMIIAVSHVNS